MSHSCFYFDKAYKGKITEGQKDIFLFHDGENAHLVVQIILRSKKFPAEIAWILPFPTLPSKYEEMNGPFFFELRSFFKTDTGHRKGSYGLGAAAGGGPKEGIKVHPTITEGQYTIQPIEILKDNSAKELNAWLKKNNFNSMPHENQKFI